MFIIGARSGGENRYLTYTGRVLESELVDSVPPEMQRLTGPPRRA